MVAGGERIRQNENDWKFQSYKGTSLGYDMLYKSLNFVKEGREGDLLNGNRIINLNNLITKIDKFLVCKEFEQKRDLQIKLEELK